MDTVASSKHWADCTRSFKLAVRDPPETDSQALVPGLDLKSLGKEYNPLFSLMGRLPKRAAYARHRQLHWAQGRDLPPTEVWLEGKRLSRGVEWLGLREDVIRGEKITLVPDEWTN